MSNKDEARSDWVTEYFFASDRSARFQIKSTEDGFDAGWDARDKAFEKYVKNEIERCAKLTVENKELRQVNAMWMWGAFGLTYLYMALIYGFDLIRYWP